MQKAPEDIALLRDGKTVYRATSSQGSSPLKSAPVALIQGIYDLKPEQARRIVRHRILTTHGSTESIMGIVKVAAKRITTSLPAEDLNFEIRADETVIDISSDLIWRPDPPALPTEEATYSANHDAQWMNIAQRLAQQVDRRGPRYASDRPIGAVLVSKDGKILAAAANTNARNRTLHAEMNLIAALDNQKIPAGARLFTTLKPCKMCAGMIHDSAEELRGLKVIFAENDPGSHARNTALDRCEFPVQSQLS